MNSEIVQIIIYLVFTTLVIVYIGRWLWGIVNTEDDTTEEINHWDVLHYHSLKFSEDELRIVVKQQDKYYYICVVSGDICRAFSNFEYTSLALMALSLDVSSKELKNTMFKYGGEVRKFKQDGGSGYIKRICFAEESKIQGFLDYCNAIKIMKKLIQ